MTASGLDNKCKTLQQNLTKCADMYIAGLFLYNRKNHIITTYSRYLLLAQTRHLSIPTMGRNWSTLRKPTFPIWWLKTISCTVTRDQHVNHWASQIILMHRVRLTDKQKEIASCHPYTILQASRISLAFYLTRKYFRLYKFSEKQTSQSFTRLGQGVKYISGLLLLILDT